ncbi:MAG: SUMF1/EgtB/PvdO family nonheme iron enzyme [Planctomycetia bacterium]|nr:SUMF1/EgtB/PvdO family nonheme iron enzyme [Planctomycetia bacterium]
MNAFSSTSRNFSADETSYAVDCGRDREPSSSKSKSRNLDYRRQGSPPSAINGIHRRRSKKWTWGSGRGARLINARAVVGVLAFVAATLSASAFGVTINYQAIGNAGNAANSVTSRGSVATAFKMQKNEVTNAEYAEFLNSQGKSNTNGIYNPLMGSDSANGGITQSGSTGAFTYSVKSNMASRPVNYVHWFSSARFTNWLHNGQLTSASTETGAYTLNNAITGNSVVRNANANVYLPNLNEWEKAAYYAGTGSTYTLYPTNSNTLPTASLSNGTNVANYNSLTTTFLNAGTYASTASFYGVQDMFGNASEWIEMTVASTSPLVMGGGFNSLTAGMKSSSDSIGGLAKTATTANTGIGFRVAAAPVAVPEPETIALAAMGIASLVGMELVQRNRRKKLLTAGLSC